VADLEGQPQKADPEPSRLDKVDGLFAWHRKRPRYCVDIVERAQVILGRELKQGIP
jgi:hypothetical protein